MKDSQSPLDVEEGVEKVFADLEELLLEVPLKGGPGLCGGPSGLIEDNWNESVC